MWAIQDAQYKKEHMHEFNENGIHRITWTEYDEKWYDREWYDSIWYNKYWIDRFWFNMKWKNTEPFYDYDREERKQRINEWKGSYKQESMVIKKSYDNNKEKVKILESELDWLRSAYRIINRNEKIDIQTKTEELKMIYKRAIYIKNKIKILQAQK